MEPLPPMAGAAPVEDLVVVDVPSYTTLSGGHSIKTVAHIRQGRLIPEPTIAPPPPRLFINISLRTISSLAPSDEQADFNFCRSFHLLVQEQAWEREARAMLTQAAADYGERIDLDFLTRAFCEHTSCAVRRLHTMMDVVSVELSSVIIVHMDYPATIGLPSFNGGDDDDDDDEHDNYEDYDDDDEDDDYDYDDDDGGSRPASAAAVEGLKMVTSEESDSCSICLEDFVMAAPLSAMPCSHLFHEACLKEWLERSCSCPLCRFSLPEEQ